MNRSLRLALFIIIGIVIYAYGFTVTQVNLDELDSPARQESLTRIIRALARPDFLEWEQEEVTVERPIYVPCPNGGAPEPTVDTAGPYMLAPPAPRPKVRSGWKASTSRPIPPARSTSSRPAASRCNWTASRPTAPAISRPPSNCATGRATSRSTCAPSPAPTSAGPT
ncbi:MAG: hypothetical protein H6644_10560 [Caldilineaceae bacterium]|nr:hypothetical protein [Caldilineaceae bacterium]